MKIDIKSSSTYTEEKKKEKSVNFDFKNGVRLIHAFDLYTSIYGKLRKREETIINLCKLEVT